MMEGDTMKVKKERTLYTVGDLIDYLEELGRDRLLIYDSDGNTGNITTNNILIWDLNDLDSPVAILDGMHK